MTEEFLTGKHEVTNEIQGLVACEFIVKSHGFFGHNFLATNDDGIFERTTLDQAFIQERFDVFVEGKRARWSDLFLVSLLVHH